MRPAYINAKIISANGGNVVSTAAYEARTKLKDQTEGVYKNYDYQELLKNNEKMKGYKNDLLYEQVFIPENAPQEYEDRETLWNAVKIKESESKRWATAQQARRLIIQLPHEYTTEDSITALKKMGNYFTTEGMCADIVLHKPEGLSKTKHNGEEKYIKNIHAHILLTTRNVTKEGFGNKNRQWNDRGFYHDTLQKELVSIMNEGLKENYLSHTPYDKTRDSYKNSEHIGPKISQIRRIQKKERDGIKELEEHIKKLSPPSLPNVYIPRGEEFEVILSRTKEQEERMKEIRKTSVYAMVKAMEKTLADDMNVIGTLKEGREKEDWKGSYFGLNEVRMQVLGIMSARAQGDKVNAKPFADIDAELRKKVNAEYDPLKKESPAFRSGYLYGLEQGRGYIDALYMHELNKDIKIAPSVKVAQRKGGR